MVSALSILCPRENDLTCKKPALRPSLDFVPQGKIRGGHNRGTQNVLWPAMVYNGRMCRKCLHAGTSATLLWFGLVWFGWLGSTDCGSHGRGPRFDPLCVH